MTIRRLIPILIGILVMVAIAAGFTIIGPPAHQRRIALDGATASDLMLLARAQRRSSDAPLRVKPPALTTYDGRLVDPTSYAYRRLTNNTFELCATFLEPSDPEMTPSALRHPAGRACFRFDAADPNVPLEPLKAP